MKQRQKKKRHTGASGLMEEGYDGVMVESDDERMKEEEG